MLPVCCNSGVKSWKNRKNPEKITKIKPFINKYNWEEGRNFTSENNDPKKIEKNNVAIAFNVLYAKKKRNISWLCFKT